MTVTKIRYDYIDISKAIAIFLMVLLHTTSSYANMSEPVGSFHMAIFFFIAGIFAKGPEASALLILKKGWMQLMVPYFIFSVCAFSICWISPYLHAEVYPTFHSFAAIFKGAFIGMFLMQDRVTEYSFMPYGPLWFLPALFWCRTFFMIWIKSGHRFYVRVVLITVLIGLFYNNVSLFSLAPAAISFPYVLLGYYAKNIVFSNGPRSNVNTNGYMYLLISLIAFIVVFILKGHSINFDGASYTGYILLAYLRGLFGTIGLISLAMLICKIPFHRVSSYLIKVGKATLAILGLHLFFLILFKIIYVLIGCSASHIAIWYAIPASIVNVCLCTLIYQKFLVKYFPAAVGMSKKFKKGPVL